MVKENSNKLTLDRPTTYQIKVPGVINKRWVNMNAEISVRFGSEDDDLPVTTLTITVDQAALHGLLRRLYSLGLPLISAIYVDVP